MSYAYIRPEGAGMMVGLFEGKAAAWNVKKIPDDFSFGQIEPDWERMFASFLTFFRILISRATGVGFQ